MFKLRILVILVAAALLAGGGYFFLSGKREWCKSGDRVTRGDATLSIIGLEDYKGDQLSGSFCHLTADVGGVSADYYLDDTALAKFHNDARKDIGNGCIVFSIKNTLAENEMCFGNNVSQ